MARIDYNCDEQFRPISAWGYVGYSLLFAIPVIGLVFLLVFAFSNKNINRMNYARSFLCWLLIGVIVLGASMAFGASPILKGYLNGATWDVRNGFAERFLRGMAGYR